MAHLHHVVIAIKRALDDVAIGAIHQHRYGLGHKGVANILSLEGDHAVFPGDVRQFNDLGDQLHRVVDLSGKRLAHHAHGTQKLAQRGPRHDDRNRTRYHNK